MSAKKARGSVQGSSFVSYVLEQLSQLDALGCRAMFGGHGLYLGPAFFGIVFDGRLYFKTHPDTVAGYVRRGMMPFRPSDKHVLKSYFEVPADVLEDRSKLAAWARVAAKSSDAEAPSPRRAAGRLQK